MINARIRGGPELRAALADVDRRVNRATMWTVREAGRQVKRQAKRNAPVLKAGTDRRAVTRRQSTAGGLAVNPNAPIRGLLRASIGSSRRLKRYGPGTYGVNVAPRGQRVHLYAGKAEAGTAFMSRAHSTVTPQVRVIAVRAYTRAMRK